MSVVTKPRLITAGEVDERRCQLLRAGLADDSIEMQALWSEVDERDDYLWDRYAVPLIAEHLGEWAAVSLDGDVLIRPTSLEAHRDTREQFGAGNFSIGRLAEFRGFDLSRC